MKILFFRKPWIRRLSGAFLVVSLVLGITGCDDDVRVKSTSYGSSYYAPYDYYYYPYSRVYFNISTGYYFYHDHDRWRRTRTLPRHYRLDHRDRVKIRVKSKDRPYIRYNEHRAKYGPRKRFDRDKHYYRDKERNKYKDRSKTKIKSHDYYFYPRSNVYYSPSSGHYYYPVRKKWISNKKLPSHYRLDNRERVKVKVKSRNKPYLKYKEHHKKYAPRREYWKSDSFYRKYRSSPRDETGEK